MAEISSISRKPGNVIKKLLLAFLMVGGIVAIDIHTKSWATAELAPNATIRGAAGFPMTLAFNQGVAFGLRLPEAGRWIIVFATLLVLVVLSNMFIKASQNDWGRLLSVQLVGAGAIGNLIDRVRWNGGVVDFIGPFDIGSMQFPIFNIADMAITTGAVLLALSLLREDAASGDVKAELAEDDRILSTDGVS
jgi:signal peptidase II